MKKARTFLLFNAVMVSFFVTVPSFSQSEKAKEFFLETSGVEAFWRIYDILSNDTEPSQQEWDAMFETPGYQLLDAKERRRSAFSDLMRLAYMPSKSAERTTKLNSNNPFAKHFLVHLEEIGKKREELKSFLSEEGIRSLVAEARVKAQRYLPTGLTERVEPAPISFFFFQSRGYKERIIMDELGLMVHPNQSGLIGHELHHSYRNFINPSAKSLGNDMLAWALVNVEVEGVACKVDKDEIPKLSIAELEKRYTDPDDLEYAKEYKKIYAQSNDWLKRVNDALEDIANNASRKQALGEQLHSQLPDNGRAMGAYMAGVIIEYLGHEQLLQAVGYGFAFWQTYNLAAKRSNSTAYTLSPKAMGVIEQLQKQYASE